MWVGRAQIAWGMPSPAFDVKQALLLLDDDDEAVLENDYDVEYVLSLQNNVQETEEVRTRRLLPYTIISPLHFSFLNFESLALFKTKATLFLSNLSTNRTDTYSLPFRV